MGHPVCNIKNANFIFCFAVRQVGNESGGFMWRTFVYDYWVQTLTVNRVVSGNIILGYLVPKSTLIDRNPRSSFVKEPHKK